MQARDRKPSSAILTEVNPEAMARYMEMRAHVMPAPGLDAPICEIVLAMQLAVLGQEVPFKIHAMRAMERGVSLAQLEGLLMAGLSVTMIACEVARAIGWVREVEGEARPPS